MTSGLHDNLRELGYDKRLEKAASEVPDAQDRLAYVVVMTEQAAERSLNATEIAKPIQDELAADAANLSGLWKQVMDTQGSGPPDTEAFKTLVAQTRNYLADVPNRTHATNAQLLEFLEHELVQLLVDNVPADKWGEASGVLLNGPVVNPEGRGDVVTNQNPVDALFESLGF